MTTDNIAFGVFVAVFGGGLATVTLGMLSVAIVLYKQNRHKYGHPARVLPFVRARAPEP
jgi:hypothetical protein